MRVTRHLTDHYVPFERLLYSFHNTCPLVSHPSAEAHPCYASPSIIMAAPPPFPYPTRHVLIPEAIIRELGANIYLVSWLPDSAGVIRDGPKTVFKDQLRARFPAVVEAWEAKQAAQRAQAEQIEIRAERLARMLASPDSVFEIMPGKSLVPEFNCDQPLQEGNHWGEVRMCDGHPMDQHGGRICKGCRVTHWQQIDYGLQGKGARMAVCSECVKRLRRSEEYFKKRCECEITWKCWECREWELKTLKRAKKDWEKSEGIEAGTCGSCGTKGELVDYVGFCVACQGFRVYLDDDQAV